MDAKRFMRSVPNGSYIVTDFRGRTRRRWFRKATKAESFAESIGGGFVDKKTAGEWVPIFTVTNYTRKDW